MARPVSELHDSLVEAIEAGDIERAAELQSELKASQHTIQSLLDEFEAAIDAQDYEKAETIIGQLQDRYESVWVEQKEAVKRSTKTRNTADISPEEMHDLQKHIESGSAITLARSAFLSSAALLLAAPDEGDPEQVKSSTQKLKDKETELAEKADAVEQTNSETTLPPDLALLAVVVPDGPHQTDATVTVGARVKNIGDTAANGVELQISGDDPLTIDPSTFSIGDMASDDSQSIEADVTADSPGEYTVKFEVTAANTASETESGDIEFSEAQTAPSVIQAIAGDDNQIGFNEVLEAIQLFNEGEPVPGTDGSTLGFQDVLRVIELFNSGETVGD